MARDSRYDAFKKRKSPKLKRARRRAEYYFMVLATAFSSLWPVRLNQLFGMFLGRMAYLCAAKDRGIGNYQLDFCYPELSARQRKTILKEAFENMGQSLFEILCQEKIQRNPAAWIALSNVGVVRDARKEGRGIILLFGHVGNWELIPTIYDMLDIPGIAIGSPVDDEKLDGLLTRYRKTKRLKLIERKGNKAAKSIINCFRSNGMISLAIDQDTRVKSVFTEFFGKKAATAVGPAVFAQKFQAPVISAFGARKKNGTHRYRFELLSRAPYERGAAEIDRLTQSYTAAFEKHVRQYPNQWAWFHRRWKTQPDRTETDRE